MPLWAKSACENQGMRTSSYPEQLETQTLGLPPATIFYFFSHELQPQSLAFGFGDLVILQGPESHAENVFVW